ncbi:response regulator [Mixta mediterraneensis]|uniref:response regulator n=1 Tax=Mixta mediterraneensis TaxID=2758443 RepID=UPI00187591F3|nr:response regulator [Mixta mediterraneensis]MBE5254063.1 response regulator [Mixta mediterraneensis]
MRILLVEDEIHKRDELVQCIKSVYDIEPKIVDCVNDAVLTVRSNDNDLIILDMALSTFSDHSTDKKKGHDQAQGGIEVLRALKASRKKTKVMIVTQYPDFYIGGVKVKLQNSPKVVEEKYNQIMIGAVLYTYKSKPILQRIISILRKHA